MWLFGNVNTMPRYNTYAMKKHVCRCKYKGQTGRGLVDYTAVATDLGMEYR